jgi:hypothetical protein
MKNTQKGSTVIILLVIIILLLLGIGFYLYKNQKVENSVVIDQESTKNNNSQKFETSDFSISFPKDTLVQVPFSQTLPPNYLKQYNGIKFIFENRANLIGKKGCYYGESGLESVCTANKEEGISFIVVDDSISNLTSNLSASSKSNTTIYGKQAIAWKIGAEGDGIDYYYMSMNQNKTLVISRQYTYKNSFILSQLFDEIVSTLKIK